jgi:regulator of cell morphogenesis and NO signaling
MTENTYYKTSLGEIVAEDFRSAKIFTNAGIDFCCGGKKTLEEACLEKNIDLYKVAHELSELESNPANTSQNFKDWDLDFLSDYIINAHHKYVIKTLPDLVFYTKKIATVHGSHHPELIEIASLFGQLNSELLQHLQKEEEVLFPAIKDALRNNSMQAKTTIQSEIARMTGEHEFAGGTLDKINTITSGYQTPEDACNTYIVCFRLLKEFEDNLHIHVHLENNLLYPKALLL